MQFFLEWFKRCRPAIVLFVVIQIVFSCSDGGYFKAHLIFSEDYPQKPPKMKFISDIWHPNGLSLIVTFILFF